MEDENGTVIQTMETSAENSLVNVVYSEAVTGGFFIYTARLGLIL